MTCWTGTVGCAVGKHRHNQVADNTWQPQLTLVELCAKWGITNSRGHGGGVGGKRHKYTLSLGAILVDCIQLSVPEKLRWKRILQKCCTCSQFIQAMNATKPRADYAEALQAVGRCP